jgi:hypothetical protein
MGSDRDDKAFDVLDMVINFLREHEKTLDELVYRIEQALAEKAPTRRAPEEPRAGAVGISVSTNRWTEFKRRCEGASLIGFVARDSIFKVTAIAGGILYVYKEELPTMEIRYRKVNDEMEISGVEADTVVLVLKALKGELDCGLELDVREIELGKVDEESVRRVVCGLDMGATREWLAREMGVDPSSIVEGEINLPDGG